LKKGLSILLLFVFLFNVGGYYIVYWGLRYQTYQQLSQRLDAGLYHPEETIELKIPVNLPYPVQSDEFQRIDGRFEYNGEHFRLIKQKLENDTLFIVCIRDAETKQIVRTIKNYLQLTQGLSGTPSQKALHFLSKIIQDYCSLKGIEIIHQNGFSMTLRYKQMVQHFVQPSIPVHSPPPRS